LAQGIFLGRIQLAVLSGGLAQPATVHAASQRPFRPASAMVSRFAAYVLCGAAVLPIGCSIGLGSVQHSLTEQQAGQMQAVATYLYGRSAILNASEAPWQGLPFFKQFDKFGNMMKVMGGYARYGLGCMLPGDHLKAAQDVANAQLAFGDVLGNHGLVERVDGKYCYKAGLCDHGHDARYFSKEDGAKYCNERFGTEWHHSSMANLNDNVIEGLKSESAEPWIAAAQIMCKVGIVHCDMVYCQDLVCKSEYKFDPSMPEIPGANSLIDSLKSMR